MTTLEYLQLTTRQKLKGIYITGSSGNGEYKEWNGVSSWRSNKIYLYRHCFYENEILCKFYKRWDCDGKLIDNYIIGDSIK